MVSLCDNNCFFPFVVPFGIDSVDYLDVILPVRYTFNGVVYVIDDPIMYFNSHNDMRKKTMFHVNIKNNIFEREIRFFLFIFNGEFKVVFHW